MIGTVAEFPTRRRAMQVLSQKLRAINRGDARPQSVRTFGDFVENDWMPVILPAIKYATQKDYRSMLDVHLIPALKSLFLSFYSPSSTNRKPKAPERSMHGAIINNLPCSLNL